MNNFINNLSPLQIVGNISSSTKWILTKAGITERLRRYDMDGDGIGMCHRIHNIFEYLREITRGCVYI